MIRKHLLLLIPVAVVFAAVIGGIAAVTGSGQNQQNTACARTSVELTSPPDFMSNSVDIVVLVNGSSSVSISQQVVQSNDRSRVEIDVEFDDGSVTISGETAENGSLVLDVTRDGTVLHESVVVNGSDNQLVFHIDQNGDVHIDRDQESGGCQCATGSDDADVHVDADGVDVQINEEENEEYDVNVDSDGSDDDDATYETDGGRDIGCSESTSCLCSDSATEISSPVRQSPDSTRTGVSVMRVILRSSDFAGLAMPGRSADCVGMAADATTDCRDDRGNPSG